MPALPYERHTFCQTRSARQRPRAADAAAVGCLSKASGRESLRVCHAHYRHADAGVSTDFPGGNTGTKDYGTQLADAVSPDAGALRVLLRLFALDNLCCL